MMLYYSDEKVDFLIHKQKLVFLGFYAVLEMTIINKCQVISGCLHFERKGSKSHIVLMQQDCLWWRYPCKEV